jgi:O-antigen ligase
MALPWKRLDALVLGAIAIGALGAVLASLPAPFLDVERFQYPKELALHLTALIAAPAALWSARQDKLRVGPVDAALCAWLLLSAAAALATVWTEQNPWLALRALSITSSSVAVFFVASSMSARGLGAPLLAIAVAATALVAGGVVLEAFGWVDTLSLPRRGPGATLGVRNYAAHFIAIGVPSAALLAFRARRKLWVAAPCLLTLSLAACALILTRCRAAWVSMFVASLVMGALLLLRRSRGGEGEGRWTIAPVALALVAGVVVAVAAPNALNWRAEHPYQETLSRLVEYDRGSGRGRIEQHQRALAMIAAHPVLGVGPGNWTTSYARFAGTVDATYKPKTIWPVPAYPASDWVAASTERGVPALVALLVFVALLGRSSLRALRERPHDTAHALTTLAVLAAVSALDAVLQLAAPSLLAAIACGATRAPERGAWALPAPAGRWTAIACLLLWAIVLTPLSVRHVQAGARLSEARDANDLEGYAEAAALFVGHARIHAYLALRFERDGKCDRAIPHAIEALKNDPTLALAEQIRARCESSQIGEP